MTKINKSLVRIGTINILKTLSKILCKWKQDSAVSLSLYLDSVFKEYKQQKC